MLRIILLFALTFNLISIKAQIRENRPIIEFSENKPNILSDNVTGWSYSLDGQWVSGENLIPIRAISSDKKKYETNINKLGLDNFKNFYFYSGTYGTDSVVILAKVYEDGHYKYTQTKKGWKRRSYAYFYVFMRSELEKLDQLEDTTRQMIRVNLLDGGLIKDINENNLIDHLKASVNVVDDYDRYLTIMVEPFPNSNIIRFQFFSQHDIFEDVQGVLRDLDPRGRSMYGRIELFDYLYYETDLGTFSSFFRPTTSLDE